MTRIAIFGDLHGNHLATEATLADIDSAGVDQVYCLGDLVGYGPRPNEVIDLVRSRAIPVVMGNYDDGVGFDRDDCGCAYKDAGEHERGQKSLFWTREVVNSEGKAFLRGLPFDIRLNSGTTRVRLVHGSPRRINEYLFEDREQRSLERIASVAEADILVFGHTHKPWTREISGVRFINAGSSGKPKDGDPRACWLLLDLAPNAAPGIEFRRVAYDVAAVAQLIRAEPALPDEFATDLETGGR